MLPCAGLRPFKSPVGARAQPPRPGLSPPPRAPAGGCGERRGLAAQGGGTGRAEPGAWGGRWPQGAARSPPAPTCASAGLFLPRPTGPVGSGVARPAALPRSPHRPRDPALTARLRRPGCPWRGAGRAAAPGAAQRLRTDPGPDPAPAPLPAAPRPNGGGGAAVGAAPRAPRRAAPPRERGGGTGTGTMRGPGLRCRRGAGRTGGETQGPSPAPPCPKGRGLPGQPGVPPFRATLLGASTPCQQTLYPQPHTRSGTSMPPCMGTLPHATLPGLPQPHSSLLASSPTPHHLPWDRVRLPTSLQTPSLYWGLTPQT